MLPDQIRISDFSYELPDERIARFPVTDRGQSKLLVFRNQTLIHTAFDNLVEWLPDGSCLFWNDTRVIQARLRFKKTTGSLVEVFLLEPVSPAGYALMFTCHGHCIWKALIGNQKKWKGGPLCSTAVVNGTRITVSVEIVEQTRDEPLVRLSWEPENLSFAEILDRFGETPIPPYLKRAAVGEDKIRYQTIYASYDGSVAAPTAGLHFNQEVIERLSQKGIRISAVTLHVGAGTFIPVKSKTVEGHQMHPEPVTINRSVIVELLHSRKELITAVGTTTLRSLESLYWIGRKIRDNYPGSNQPLILEQWEAYRYKEVIDYHEIMSEVLDYMDASHLGHLAFVTRLMIVPGYDFQMIGRLMTNFHQPGSSLLLLVAALTGNYWKTIYQYALDNGFRFLSYGDSSLLDQYPQP